MFSTGLLLRTHTRRYHGVVCHRRNFSAAGPSSLRRLPVHTVPTVAPRPPVSNDDGQEECGGHDTGDYQPDSESEPLSAEDILKEVRKRSYNINHEVSPPLSPPILLPLIPHQQVPICGPTTAGVGQM